MNPIILLAAEVMTKAHGMVKNEDGTVGQRRKYTGEPYAVHPIAVARMVQEHDGTDDMVCAAMLHDVVEDTSYTHGNLLTIFGPQICDLVMQVTNVSEAIDGNREKRKAMDAAHFSAASPQGQTIKLADLIDNARTILLHDKNFAVRFFVEKRALLATMTRGDGRLYHQAMRMVEEYFDNQEKEKSCTSTA